MTTKEKLLKRLPKKYHEYIKEFEKESGLIDNCQYMLYFADNYMYYDYTSLPVNSINEAIHFIKAAHKIEE